MFYNSLDFSPGVCIRGTLQMSQSMQNNPNILSHDIREKTMKKIIVSAKPSIPCRPLKLALFKLTSMKRDEHCFTCEVLIQDAMTKSLAAHITCFSKIKGQSLAFEIPYHFQPKHLTGPAQCRLSPRKNLSSALEVWICPRNLHLLLWMRRRRFLLHFLLLCCIEVF